MDLPTLEGWKTELNFVVGGWELISRLIQVVTGPGLEQLCWLRAARQSLEAAIIIYIGQGVTACWQCVRDKSVWLWEVLDIL